MKNGSNLGMIQTAAPAISRLKSLPATGKRAKLKANGKSSEEISIGTQLGMFAALTLSVIASRFLDYYRAGVSWSPAGDWDYLLFALIVSFMTFPLVYRKVQRNRSDPMLVKLGLIFAAGMGWEKVLSTTTDLLKRAH